MITIYALLRSGKVVYVGQSNNVKNRVYQHSLEKEFDDYVELDKVETKEGACVLEDHYIIKHEPSYNKCLNSVGILVELEDYCKSEKLDLEKTKQALAKSNISPIYKNKFSLQVLENGEYEKYELPEKEDTEELTCIDMSKLFDVHRSTVINWIEREGLPCYEADGTIMFKKSEVLKWIETKNRNKSQKIK